MMQVMMMMKCRSRDGLGSDDELLFDVVDEDERILVGCCCDGIQQHGLGRSRLATRKN